MAILTITTDAAQDVRLIAALKQAQGMPLDPTPAECKSFVIRLMREFVIHQEYIMAQAQITSTPFNPT